MKTKKELLENYNRKEPKMFLQIDGHYMTDSGDEIISPDNEGDCICSGKTYELMHGANVRVLITPNTDGKTAARLLEKIIKELKQNEHIINKFNWEHEEEQKVSTLYKNLVAAGYSNQELFALAKIAKPDYDEVPF